MNSIKRKLLVMSVVLVMMGFSTACNYDDPEIRTDDDPEIRTEDSILYTLKLDQKEAFVAISANDDSMYNRAFPFYFYLETSTDFENSTDLERWLHGLFDNVSLFTPEEFLFLKTSKFVWAPGEIEPNKFNLTLMVFPESDNLSLTGVQQIKKIVFSNENGSLGFQLSPYYIEERATIPSSELLVTSSPVDTSLNADLTAAVGYQISSGNNDYDDSEIDNFKLTWPRIFSNLDDFILTGTIDSDEGRDFLGYLKFKEEVHKIVFRPFIEVNFRGEMVVLIPVLPVYIN